MSIDMTTINKRETIKLWAEACVAMEVKLCKAESKCRANAEEYK